MYDQNFHTHIWRCKHAVGDVHDYAREAAARGLRVLGISDHVPLPDDRWSDVRMAMGDIDAYFASIEAERRHFPELRLLRAFECEYEPEYDSWYREELLGSGKVDYLVGSAHFVEIDGRSVPSGRIHDAHGLRIYARYLVRTMESGLFAFIGHPDMYAHGYMTWDRHAEDCAREILAAARDLRIPLEINGYGLRKPPVQAPDGIRPQYPWEPFWRLAAEYDVEFVANSDAHEPENVATGLRECTEIGKRHGLRAADMLARIASFRKG